MIAEPMPYPNRRKHARVKPKQLATRVRAGEELHIGLGIENISMGGVFVRCNTPLKVGRVVTLELLRPENRKVLAYIRRYESESILCIANLSRFLQAVELDLSKWKGLVPVELFSGNEMPVVGDAPYFLTLGPHSFYWFALQPKATPMISSDGTQAASVPEVRVAGTWEAALTGPGKERLENILLGYVRNRRWFAGKARRLKSAQISEVVPVPGAVGGAYLAWVVITYAEGDPDTYVVPMAHASAAEAPQIRERWPHAAIAWLRTDGEEQRGLLYDALGPPGFAEALLGVIVSQKSMPPNNGTP